MSRANARQVGGSHYRGLKKQHWDIVDEYGVPYLEGVASKYPLRWRDKGGVEDLQKTLHYIDKILESSDKNFRWSRLLHLNSLLVSDARELVNNHSCGTVEANTVQTLLCGFNRPTLTTVRKELAQYIDELILLMPESAFRPGTPEDGGHHARQEEPASSVVNNARVQSTITLVLPDRSVGEIRSVGEATTVTWGPSS